jgi:ATPase subunit of ABC transporter with duplicated ATPase domains
MSLGTITDAHNALGRLTDVFLADVRKEAFEVDEKSEAAVRVENASFVWEATPEESPDAPKSKKQQAQIAAKLKAEKKQERKELKAAEKAAAKRKDDEKAVETELDGNGPVDSTAIMVGGPTDVALGNPTNKDDPTTTPAEQETLQLRDINVTIQKGELCAVAGPVGAGKSSFLQALIGEMKRTKGSVKFGGSIAYASQQAWMQSCSLRVSWKDWQ